MAVTLNAAMTAGNQGDTHALSNVASFSVSGAITIAAGSNRALYVTAAWGNPSSSVVEPTARSLTWNGASVPEIAYLSTLAAGSQRETVAIYELLNPAVGALALAGNWTGLVDVYVSAVCFNGAGGYVLADNVTSSSTTFAVVGTSDGATIGTHVRNGGVPTLPIAGGVLFWDYDALNPGGGGAYRIGLTGTNTYDFNTGTTGSCRAGAAIHTIAGSGGGSAGGTLLGSLRRSPLLGGRLLR